MGVPEQRRRTETQVPPDVAQVVGVHQREPDKVEEQEETVEGELETELDQLEVDPGLLEREEHEVPPDPSPTPSPTSVCQSRVPSHPRTSD